MGFLLYYLYTYMYLYYVSSLESLPNIVIFMADDLGYNDIGVFGSVLINTPNINTLALEGLKLTQFYSTAPLCSASRAALLTGRLPQRTGSYTNYSYPRDLQYRVYYPTSVGAIPSTEITLANLLSTKGYFNKIIGKWHLGHNEALPTLRGFDSFYGLPYSHEEGFPGPNPEDLVYPPVPLMRDLDIIEQPVNLTTLTPRYNLEAINFLQNISKSKQPFFLYMAYEQPHVPLFLSSGFGNKSRRGLYGDSVSEMDNSIGVVLNELKKLNLINNTLIIFSSDNGAWTNPTGGTSIKKSSTSYTFDGGSNAPFRGGKGSTWEGGVRVPAIIWYPKLISAFSTCMCPILNMDLLPTIAHLLNITLADNVIYDGINVLDYLINPSICDNNNNNDPRDYIYYWRGRYLYAVRYKQYKANYITRPGFGKKPPIRHNPPLLYNIELDVSESIELNTSLPEYQNILQIIDSAKIKHENDVYSDIGYPMFDPQDWLLVPCCNKGFNITEAKEYWNENEKGLAIWDECVCNYKP